MVCRTQDGKSVCVKEQTVKHVDNDHVDDRIGGQDRFCDRDAQKTDIGIDSHQMIETTVFF